MRGESGAADSDPDALRGVVFPFSAIGRTMGTRLDKWELLIATLGKSC